MTPKLEQLKATYTQPDDLSCNYQELTIFTDDAGGGKYFVIQTERWAFDNVDELIDLILNFKEKTV